VRKARKKQGMISPEMRICGEHLHMNFWVKSSKKGEEGGWRKSQFFRGFIPEVDLRHLNTLQAQTSQEEAVLTRLETRSMASTWSASTLSFYLQTHLASFHPSLAEVGSTCTMLSFGYKKERYSSWPHGLSFSQE
jgi:hypothetical protein